MKTADHHPDSDSPTFFHIGIIVEDLEEAEAHYSALLGLTFTDPATFHIPILEDPDPHPQDLVAIFSREGPPFYEILLATGETGVFSKQNAGQIFYVGIYEHDIPGRIEKLKAQGIGIDALLKSPEGDPFVIMTSPDRYGLRIEYVGDSSKGGIDHWVETGHFDGL